MKRIPPFVKYTALALVALLVLMAVALQLPPVQTFIAKKATAMLVEKTGARISVGKVAINLPDNVRLNDIYLEDLQNDTILYAGRLKVDISLFALLLQKIKIDNVALKDAVVNIRQDGKDGKFNFQYLIDAFASESKEPKDTTPSPWTFSINSAELENVRTHIDLPSVEIKGAIAEFSVETDEFDLKKRVMDYEHVRLKNSDVAITLPQRDSSFIEVDTSSKKLLYIMPDIGWTIKASEIEFANNNVSFDDNNKKPQPHGVDYLHLAATNLNIQISNASYVGHVLKADIGNISMNEKSGAHLRQLKGAFSIDEKSIMLNSLKADLNKSQITCSGWLKFQDLSELAQFSKNVGIEVFLNKSHVSPADVIMFVPQLGQIEGVNLNSLDSIYIDGAVFGTVGNLSAKNFICSVENGVKLNLDFSAEKLPDMDSATFNLTFEDFSAAPLFLESLIKTKLPDEFMRLGKLSLKGKYSGSIRDMRFDGTILTQVGTVYPNLHVRFNNDYTNANYEGDIRLEDFQLGKVLGDTTIGSITLDAKINGEGLAIDSLHANLKAEVAEATYNKYTYKNLAVDGKFDRKKFNGNASVNDENVKLDFTGFVDLNDSIPDFRFEASLDTLNLKALHLTDYNISIHADVTGNLNATSSNLNGRASIKNIRLGKDSLHCSIDSLVASASTEGGNQTIKVESPIINGSLSGDFNLPTLPYLFLRYLNSYFPISKEPKSAKAISNQKFDLQVTVSHPLEAVRIFVPQILKWDTASMVASFNSEDQSFKLKLDAPGIIYDSIKTGTISLLSSGNRDTLNVSASVENVDYSDKMKLPLVSVKVNASNKIINLDLAIDSGSTRQFAIATSISSQAEKFFRMSLRDGLIISDEKWAISDDNYIDFRPRFLNVHHVEISKDNQSISITSPQNSDDSVTITFNDFDLRELSDMARFNEIQLDGKINGILTLNDIFSKPSFTSDMRVNDIVINKNPVGNLTVKAVQRNTDIDVNISLTGNENNLLVTGKVMPESSKMHLDIVINHLNLSAADPFLKEFISDSKGYFSAELKAEGEFTNPSINGDISMHRISTHAVYSNARYTFADNHIDVNSKKISLNHLELFDEQNRKITFDGFLTHENFRNLNFDLTLNSDEFLFLNTEKSNDFLYGTVLLAINAHLTGTPELPVVDAKVSTKPGTRVFILPMSQEESIKQEDFVLFQSPPFDVADDDSLITTQLQYKARVTGVDLHLAFELTRDAVLQIIIDPYAGDKLTCKGSANLSVYIPPVGSPQVNGSYIVESGDYSFSYQRMLKRQFVISQGSRIDFSGDVMDALLDIKAVYTAKASSYELIAAESASLSSSEISATKKRGPVDVILTIRGDIAQPELTYDVRFPENTGNVTSSAAERKLMQLRQDQAELSKQVFALLVFNSFIADYSTGGTDWGTASANVALQSVSGMITSQLNKLSNFSEGLEVNLDLTSYQDQFGTGSSSENVTEMGFDISKQFLNERLEVTVGGNVNLDNSASGQSGDVSNFTGDFAIEYKLTESGKYRVKVFRTGNYDMINQSNIYRTGVGLTYRHSFKSILPKRKEEKINGNAKD